jgi:uncharacterized protein
LRVISFAACLALALSLSAAPKAFPSASSSQNTKQSSKIQKAEKPAQPHTDQSEVAEKPSGPAKAKVRAITAFIQLNRANYQQQVVDTVAFLQQAKSALVEGGFEVQTLRIATQPFGDYIGDISEVDGFKFLRELDRFAVAQDVVISVGPAMLQIGDDPKRAELLANALAPAANMNGSVLISGEDGIHWDAIDSAASLIQFLAVHSPRSSANIRFAASSLPPPATPFFPTAYEHANDHSFSIGLQSANVIMEALSETHDPGAAKIAIEEKLGAQAKQIEEISKSVETKTRWKYEGLDLSPAPLKRESIGAAIESFNGAWFGSSGTLSTAAIITHALQSIPVAPAGYSGLMLPVLEDQVIAKRWSEGSLSIDGMLSYSAVCGTGLDMIPLPGRVTHEQLVKILGDVASLSLKWHKPLSARLLPVAGKDAGDRTDFDDPRIVNAMIRPLP